MNILCGGTIVGVLFDALLDAFLKAFLWLVSKWPYMDTAVSYITYFIFGYHGR